MGQDRRSSSSGDGSFGTSATGRHSLSGAGFVGDHDHVHLTLGRAGVFLGGGFSVKPGRIQVGLELASNVEDVQVCRF